MKAERFLRVILIVFFCWLVYMVATDEPLIIKHECWVWNWDIYIKCNWDEELNLFVNNYSDGNR